MDSTALMNSRPLGNVVCTGGDLWQPKLGQRRQHMKIQPAQSHGYHLAI